MIYRQSEVPRHSCSLHVILALILIYVVKLCFICITDTWKCSLSKKKLGSLCPAVIRQSNQMFVHGEKRHIHEPNPDLLVSRKIALGCKEAAIAAPFKASGAAVSEVLNDVLNRKRRYPFLSKVNDTCVIKYLI